MIEQAILLLAKKGLQGASFSEVLQASGAPRGSLYHHFPGGKEELVLAALGAAGDMALDYLGTLEGKPAAEVVEGFAALWRRGLIGSDFGAGCAVVAVTVAANSSVLIQGAADVFRAWRARLSDLLTEAGLANARAPTVAALVISACEGAIALSRAERSLEPFDFVVAELRRAVEEATTELRSG
jgi:TetR/AcrR family transcriptional repressor of lmrAB and yxaGH operons